MFLGQLPLAPLRRVTNMLLLLITVCHETFIDYEDYMYIKLYCIGIFISNFFQCLLLLLVLSLYVFVYFLQRLPSCLIVVNTRRSYILLSHFIKHKNIVYVLLLHFFIQRVHRIVLFFYNCINLYHIVKSCVIAIQSYLSQVPVQFIHTLKYVNSLIEPYCIIPSLIYVCIYNYINIYYHSNKFRFLILMIYYNDGSKK